MYKFMLSFVFLLAFVTNASAQIKIEGEKQATVGYMLKLKLTQLAVDDPQIKCFPDNPDWIATKDFAGQAWIIYVPGKKAVPAGQTQVLYTFVVAGSKGGKTFLETHEVVVKADEDSPVVPVPDPNDITKSALYKDLFAAYKVSPDADSKSKLIAVYEVFLEDVKSGKFTSFKEAGDSLAKVTPKALGTNLQKVRDAVGDYFIEAVGQQGWNQAKLSTAVTQVIAVLKKIPG
jgi:hypothetical protein